MRSRTPMVSGRLPGHSPSIRDMAAVEHDGEPVFLCATGESTIWSWRPSSDAWREHDFDLPAGSDAVASETGVSYHNEFDQLAAVVHDGRIIVGAGDDEQAPALWDLETGRLLDGYAVDAPYTGAITAIGGQNPRIVTGLQYVGVVRSWDPSGQLAPVEFHDDVNEVRSLAAARIGDRVLLAIGDETVTVRDLSTRELVASLDTEPTDDDDWADDLDEDDEDDADDRIFAVAIDRVDGRPVVLGGSAEPGKVFVWDLATGGLLDRPLSGHGDLINSIATTTVDGRLIAATGSDDGTVRLWDINAHSVIGEPITDHEYPVEAVLITTFADCEILATAGRDGVIRVWDLAGLLS